MVTGYTIMMWGIDHLNSVAWVADSADCFIIAVWASFNYWRAAVARRSSIINVACLTHTIRSWESSMVVYWVTWIAIVIVDMATRTKLWTYLALCLTTANNKEIVGLTNCAIGGYWALLAVSPIPGAKHTWSTICDVIMPRNARTFRSL